MPTLLNLNHTELKNAVVKLLRQRQRSGGRPSIKRSVLQKELTRMLELEAVLGNPRKSVEANLSRAIAALRLEKPPRLAKDRNDEMVRLPK